MTDELPPPLYVPGYFGDLPVGAYTADQMRAAILAEREACAQLIEPKNDPSDWTEFAQHSAYQAMRIRAREARSECDAALRDGLDKLIERAKGETDV
jgi:hypothetical protein